MKKQKEVYTIYLKKITNEETLENYDSILKKEDNNDKINKEIEEILEKIDKNKYNKH